MRRMMLVSVISLLATACGGDAADTAGDPIETEVAPSTTTTVVQTTETVDDREPAVVAPEFDVFLAAVAETVEGTDYEDIPFDSPELTVATGLLLCERLAAGADVDDVVVEYLTELTDGDVNQADDDQLTLTGALVGAASEALCPELMSDE